MPESSFAGPGITAPVWKPLPFTAGDYTGSGSMTFVVADAQNQCCYQLNDKTLIFGVRIMGATIGGTGNLSLHIKLPEGKTIKRSTCCPCSLVVPGATETGTLQAIADDDKLTIGRQTGNNYATGANVYIFGQLVIEVK